MRKIIVTLLAVMISLAHGAIAHDNILTKEDLKGSFLISIDVSERFLVGEIVFISEKDCTLRFASGDKPTPLWTGTYNFVEEWFTLNVELNTEQNKTLKKNISMSINLSTAKKHRVLEAVETPDPDEKKNGTEIQMGSRVEIAGFPYENATVPFRFVKNLQGNYFAGCDDDQPETLHTEKK